jgi:hypothetical protein
MSDKTAKEGKDNGETWPPGFSKMKNEMPIGYCPKYHIYYL